MSNKETVGLIVVLFLLGLAVTAVIAAVIWAVMNADNQYKEEQRKQDACLKAGGLWIDNRRTDSYCYTKQP